VTSVTQLSQVLQTVLTTVAEQAARTSHFVQRHSKLTGAAFTQTLVFGWLAEPEATYEQLAQTATALGVPISAQGLEERFTPQAADCLKRVLEQALDHLVQANPVALPLLQRFAGVYLQDGSTVALPVELAELWPGSGNGAAPTSAALKVETQFNLLDGECVHLDLLAGRDSERSAPMQIAQLPPGSLRLADLGFYSLTEWQEYDRQGAFWLSRLPPNCAVYTEAGETLDLPSVLPTVPGTFYDQSIQLSERHRLPCRLVAARVPQEVADGRRRKLRRDAKRKGYTPSARNLALCDWVLLVTNVPVSKLNDREVLVMARVRWQVELVFKLWKSQGRLDESRSAKPYRILCEVYAKLLGLLVQHWILIVTAWAYVNRSWFKTGQTIRQHIMALATQLGHLERAVGVLETIGRCLAKGARLNTRKTAPNTYQLLLACDEPNR
jgi:hypothetical protein